MRANVMKQAANLGDFSTDMVLPGIEANTSPEITFWSNRCS
jgi:hypothetical protein